MTPAGAPTEAAVLEVVVKGVPMRKLRLLALVAALGLVACGPPPKNAGIHISPDLSPVSLGDLYPLPSGQQADYGSNKYAPYAWTLLLQSEGTEQLVISKVCVVGDTNKAFTLEGPDITKVAPGAEAALRITYGDQTVRAQPDNAAIIIQSNADDYPTLVVPICAQTVADGSTRGSGGVHLPGEREARRERCDPVQVVSSRGRTARCS